MNTVDWIFHFICLMVATIYAIENVHNFLRNADMVEVGFKTFHNKTNYLYPSMTVCLNSPFNQERFQKYSSINSSLYESYLNGRRYFSNPQDFSSVPYEKVSIQERDFMVDFKVNKKDLSPVNTLTNVSTHSWGWFMGVMKCFTYDVPYEENSLVSSMVVEFKNTIFPNGERRPTDGWDSQGMHLFFHYPKQFSRSFASNKRFWPVRKPGTGYRTRFYLKEMEVLKRRHKSYDECQDNMNYDDWLVKHIVDEIKCRPPYWNVAQDEEEAPICQTKEELAKATKMFWDVFYGIKEVNIPCTEITNLDLEFEETEDYNSSENETKIAWYYRSNSYKEIRQMRAYTGMQLVGNVGGFFGLLLGYAIVQIPGLLLTIYISMKQNLSKLIKKTNKGRLTMVQNIDVEKHDRAVTFFSKIHYENDMKKLSHHVH